MKLTQGVISRDEAIKLAPEYVAYIEESKGFSALFDKFNNLRRGQRVLTHLRDSGDYVLAKVTSINHDDIRAIDGPVVRVGNGEYTWRVDGNGYAWPL